MNYIRAILSLALIFISCFVQGQSYFKWPDNKKALIVLTYDDALNSQLDNAIPQLDKSGFKATFFLNAPATELQIDRWKAVAQNGHELANHTVYHPCLSNKIKTDPKYHAENYNANAILKEISIMNRLLYAMDNKSSHTFAYPCCETEVGGRSYVDSLKKSNQVKYARTCGPEPVITDLNKLDPFLVPSVVFNSNASGQDLIDFVKRVEQSNGMGVFIFHGIGGDYLHVSSEAHQQLVDYLKANNQIWVTTFLEGMDFVTNNTKRK